ncbi:MAG: SGNH/GDSL hydrolase family protein [Ruminococcus sp.]|nr:SGNH/GDSL hydrolase family protein [Ruminococcus sp.]
MNKKIIPAALCAGIMLTGCSMTETETLKTAHTVNIPPRILFLGDSIPDGYGLDGFSRDDNSHCMSYPNILKDRYREELDGVTDTKMINQAVSGDTTQDLINIIDSGNIDDALRDSDAVVVSIGGNDLMHPIYGILNGLKDENVNLFSLAASIPNIGDDIDAALVTFEENLQVISDKLKNKTDGKIYIQNLYDPTEYLALDIITDFTGEKIAAFNDIISSHADSYSVIDIYLHFKGKSAELTNMPDFDIHPNAEGHKLIADIVDTELRKSEFTYYTYEQQEHISKPGIGLICGCAALAAVGIISLITAFVRKKS